MLSLILLLAVAFLSPAQANARDIALESALLEVFPDYEKDLDSNPENVIRYSLEKVDLNGDKKREAIVYVAGPLYCGSGGCNLLIFTPDASGYRLVTEMTLAQRPVIVSKTKTKGWNDLILRVSGGGAVPGYHVLRYDGKSYPENPSVEPDIPESEAVKGSRVLPENDELKILEIQKESE